MSRLKSRYDVDRIQLWQIRDGAAERERVTLLREAAYTKAIRTT